ncbi:DUF1127 domain-containing protein [Marinomonas sp. PE14-40]|uniref:DUF1127 domain-containing protein n=1 Tax=Marinomonas sp. PE14-40 TaxID=3060621 RepID=UPI003F67B708
MLLIALFHKIQGAMKIYSTRRQLCHLSQTQLKDIAVAPQAAMKEAKKANLWCFIHDVMKRQSKGKED